MTISMNSILCGVVGFLLGSAGVAHGSRKRNPVSFCFGLLCLLAGAAAVYLSLIDRAIDEAEDEESPAETPKAKEAVPEAPAETPKAKEAVPEAPAEAPKAEESVASEAPKAEEAVPEAPAAVEEAAPVQEDAE